ncbi:MAG: hypothetical protein CMD26_01815 [Flavobacteriales bacterium]|nr:hypothetical protein [Flavobacteriales bacterium]|tara:strand:- start:6076 stop:6591 length:516 start_codon:yes stop_codon:yes gene_type:complete
MKLVAFLSKQNISRVFVFQSINKLDINHIEYIKNHFNNVFFPTWYSHQKKIFPDLVILNSHFIIISTNSLSISGCGIDALTREIKKIALDLGIDLLNRLQIPFCNMEIEKKSILEIDRIDVKFLPYSNFIKQIKTSNKYNNIFVFNINITTSDQSWIIPIDNWKKLYCKEK